VRNIETVIKGSQSPPPHSPSTKQVPRGIERVRRADARAKRSPASLVPGEPVLGVVPRRMPTSATSTSRLEQVCRRDESVMALMIQSRQFTLHADG
jgi:hypothetical protein